MTTAVPQGSKRYSGSRVHRVEDARLLTGEGVFVDDVMLPGMLHVAFTRSPYARALILGIDTTEAAALPGVHRVLVAEDLNPGVHELWYTIIGRVRKDTPRPPLAEGQARFVGDPVAMVIAENRYIAEDAADLVAVEYQPLPPVVDYLQAEESPDLVHESHGSNVIGGLSGPPPEAVDDVLESVPFLLTETMYQQAQSPCPMEGRGLIVHRQVATGDVTIYAATQSPHEWRAFCARLVGIPEHRVRVIMRDTGGGFGQKITVLREDMCVMLAAMKVSAPLKWIEDRRENLMSAGQSRHEHATVRLGFDGDGRIEAVRIDFVEDCGAYPVPWPVWVSGTVGTMFPGPYRVPLATFTTKSIYTNTVGRCGYRGPWVFESYAREVALDIAARRMGIDPAELRRRNLLSREDQPYTNANGMEYDHISPLETFEAALRVLDYDGFRHDQAQARQRGRYLGVGIGNFVEPTTPGAGMYSTEGATIRVEPSGKVNVYLAGGSTGNSLETTAVQLTADALGVDMEDVATIQGDTAITPYGAGAGGSRSGAMIAGAIADTAGLLRERIVAIAAHQLEAAPADIELAASHATVRGTPSRAIPLSEIARWAYFMPEKLPPGTSAGLEVSGRYSARSRWGWTNATHICTCEVDIETGRVHLRRYIVAEDCGPMVNPTVVEGQIVGGAVQGLAGVLFEDLAYDEDGNPVATTFMDYLVPTAAEIPVLEYEHLETPGPGPGGYKGVGEGGVLGAVPAVTNAVADAVAPLGAKLTRLPLTPVAILAAIAG